MPDATAAAAAAPPGEVKQGALLDAATAAIIKETWAVVKTNQDVDRLGALLFHKFLAKTGDGARKLFNRTDMGRQAHVVAPVVEWLIQNPDEQALVALGVYHAHLGVSASQLQDFAVCFVEAVLEVLPEDVITATVKDAWTAAMQLLQENVARRLTCYVKSLDSIRVSGDSGEAARSLMADAPAPTPTRPAAKGKEPDGAILCKMRAKAECSQLARLAKPEMSGPLRLSTYARHRIKAPKRDGQHVMHLFRAKYVWLQGQYLYYGPGKDAKPEGIIDVCQCELIDTSSPSSPLPSPSPFSFALRDHAHLTYPYYFVCTGDEEKELWFVALRKACNRFSFIRSDLHAGQKVVIMDAVTPAQPGKSPASAPLDKNKPSVKESFGICRWTGQYGKNQDLWVGVELDLPVAHGHNGTVDGHAYFTCEAGYGVMVPAYLVSSASPLEIQVRGPDAEKPLKMDYTPSQFEFLALIGRGSFGRVCKVRERATGKIFAVKILQKAALLRESQITNVRREKSILLNIHHPFIVRLHAAFQSKGRLFLLFDFLSGGELFTHVQASRDGYLSEGAARFYLAEVALAISYLHSLHIVHRDLKAENLVLDRTGHCVLTDFGFAKTVLANEHNTTRCGTLPYMAPEILKQSLDGYGLAVDWWAMGVLLFLLTTGCYPFWDNDTKDTVRQILTRKITMHNFPPTPVLSEACRSLILALIKKDPSHRLQTIDALKAHPWYAGFDWDGCYKRKLTPPFVPDPKGKNTKYFDLSERHVQGHSAPLPHDWNKDHAFASFQDVHAKYKPYDDTITGEALSEGEFYEGLHREDDWVEDDAQTTPRTFEPFILRT
eukprot:TRINITY_DN5017_c0_g3_i1.p1 TRINITY_DN5017_c0_g3~~TRINITY_DN5017_c0_g3_i1.p1  ORF type:complete len:833 (+),score=309.87 TRINITY_DN5017_c0_g3_i1:59-2557(+)